jgi:hypothetical protein
MKINKNSLVLAAAFTGLLGGTMARVNAAPASGSSLPPCCRQRTARTKRISKSTLARD